MKKIKNFLFWCYHPLNLWTNKHNYSLKVAISLFGPLAGVLFLFYRDSFIRGSRNFLKYIFKDGGGYSVNFTITFFWIVIIIWIFFYFKVTFNETNANQKKSDENRKLMNEIKASIHNAPNPNIFAEFDAIYSYIHERVKLITFESKISGKKEITVYRDALIEFLKKISELTSKFSGNNTGNYGANIMQYINAKTNLDDIRRLMVNETKWIYLRHFDVAQFRGALSTEHSLIFYEENKIIPELTLPIIKLEDAFIPGAPVAVIRGEAVINDTSKNENGIEKSGYQHEIDNTTKVFFSGRGKDIKSYASIRILVGGAPPLYLVQNDLPTIVGVLTVYCSELDLLGIDELYYTTYFALLKPITVLIEPILTDFYELAHNQ